ncbi:phage tail protein [Chromobacterium violaceum]
MAETFTWRPAFGASASVHPAVTTSRFGDGYAQRVPSGINTMPAKLSLSFNNLSRASADALESFLARHGGVRWFWYAHAGRSAAKFICSEWQRTNQDRDADSITCSFEQVFDIGN